MLLLPLASHLLRFRDVFLRYRLDEYFHAFTRIFIPL